MQVAWMLMHMSNRLQGQPFQVFEGLGTGKHFVAGLGIIRSTAKALSSPSLATPKPRTRTLPCPACKVCSMLLSLDMATSSANEVEGILTSGTATVKTHLFLHANHRVLL